MASNIIIEPPKPHDPTAVAWLARPLGHEEVPEVLKVNDRLALVRGSKGGYYSVTRKNGDYWRCSCPAGDHGARYCRHLKALSASENTRQSGETAAQAHQRKQREILAQRCQGTEDLELIPRSKFAPILESALATERSMLGDAPGRIDLSEPLKEVA